MRAYYWAGLQAFVVVEGGAILIWISWFSWNHLLFHVRFQNWWWTHVWNMHHQLPNNNQNNKFTTWPTYQIIRKYDIPITVNKSCTFLTTPRILHTCLKQSNIDNPLRPWQQSKFYRQDALPPSPSLCWDFGGIRNLLIWMRVWILEGLFGVHFLFWKLQLYMHNNQYL